MPSLHSILKSSKDSQQVDHSNVTGGENASAEKAPSTSKRDFLRKLIKRSSARQDSTEEKWLQKQDNSVANTEKSLQTPQQPSSSLMSNPNKPLPPPPPPGTVEEPPSKAPVRLDRIIAPLATEDLHKAFSGAPQFFARSEGHGTGAAYPFTAFPFDSELEIRDLTDHNQIQDEAWKSVSAWPHITVQVSKNPAAVKEHHEKQNAHFLPRCRERPNMLSMQGRERGTMGFQAALELGVSDALHTPKESHPNSRTISEYRRKFLNGKDGLRPLADQALIDRLISVGEQYHEDPKEHARPTIELYTELFTQILYPPSRVTDSEDPYSLQVQIEVLIEVLAAEHVWVDFSQVEWRIRLGQILWGTRSEEDLVLDGDEEIMDEPNTEKYWLLLQILLSCELLVRLDAVARAMDCGKEAIKSDEIRRFDKSATTSVRWSMVLARQWLENIRVEKKYTGDVTEKKPPTGWLASLTSAPAAEVVPSETLNNARFEGRYQTRQLLGLVHFAKKLNYPGVDNIAAKVTSNGITISDSTMDSPVGTPRSIATQRSSSYFSRRPIVRRGISSLSNRMSAIIHPSGWLSNSYISGFILPGESLSHLLISTLLESDEVAVTKLGEEANLYGGFVYSGRSFWSTCCVVGRVLAAGKGASECMGWMSSDILPRGTGEGWVDIDVDEVENPELDKKDSRPRIQRKATIERNGHITGGADPSSALPGDFVLLSDDSTQAALIVTFESLDLFAAADSGHSTPAEEDPALPSEESVTSKIKTYSAMMRFSVQAEGKDPKEVNLALSNNVYFVTAHPCVPSGDIGPLKSPTSPSFRFAEANHSLKPTGHPLHKAFTYTALPIHQLLSTPTTTFFETLLNFPSTQSSTHTTSSTIPKVLVIDCTDSTMNANMFPPSLSSPSSPTIGTDVEKSHRRFGSDLEMLARAFCSERGWNAIISRRGRGCLACAVREAGSLGWRVILRVA